VIPLCKYTGVLAIKSLRELHSHTCTGIYNFTRVVAVSGNVSEQHDHTNNSMALRVPLPFGLLLEHYVGICDYGPVFAPNLYIKAV